MNFSFLVDLNLPKYFSFFNENHFTFVSDIDLQMSDSEIWDYALKNELVILTKDTDFYNRFLISENAPKIIYFQLGNFSLKQLYQYFNDNWEKIQSEIENSNLIIAKENHIECIR
jgi:predicted nuclease of predicted toxin-antitoxin system